MPTPDAGQITNNHTGQEGDAPPLEEYRRIIDSMNPDPETRDKLRRLLEPPISDFNRDVAAGVIQAMQAIQDYAQELPHVEPNRKTEIYTHVRILQILLHSLLNAAVDGRPVSNRRSVLEFLETNSGVFSSPFFTAIARVYGDPRFQGTSATEGADV